MNVTVHTDGSCWPNPGGPGGWACVIESDGRRIELSGKEPNPTTNNRMEMTAAIEALKFLPRGSVVIIVTDSQYLRNGGSSWIKLWNRRNWRTRDGSPVKNYDLWQEIARLAAFHRVKWKWVRSHQNKGTENDRCDTLANNARAEALEKGNE